MTDPGLPQQPVWRTVLGDRGIGRVVFTRQALPDVVTVNYVVVEGRVHFRTAPDTALARAVADAVVAFNVDDLDRPGGQGISVTITGRCRLVAEPSPELHRRLEAWAPGLRDLFFVVDEAEVAAESVGV